MLEKNEAVCLLGMSGSGKTTLLSILSGLLPPTSGSVHVGKNELYNDNTKIQPIERSKLFGLIFQDFALLDHLTVIDNLIIARWFNEPDPEECSKLAYNLLKSMGLQNHMSKYPNQLSSGQKQRVGIARALINNPSIIFADEPTGSLDTQNSTNIMKMLLSLIEGERSVIYSTHNIEIAKFATRVVMLKDGALVEVKKTMLENSKTILDLYKMTR
jgi:ABC-type lipoprotein export system ATPase subunit